MSILSIVVNCPATAINMVYYKARAKEHRFDVMICLLVVMDEEGSTTLPTYVGHTPFWNRGALVGFVESIIGCMEVRIQATPQLVLFRHMSPHVQITACCCR